VLPIDFYDVTGTDTSNKKTNKKLLSIVGHGTKVAEGGQYDALVHCVILVFCVYVLLPAPDIMSPGCNAI
jgi:hypothetical protein